MTYEEHRYFFLRLLLASMRLYTSLDPVRNAVFSVADITAAQTLFRASSPFDVELRLTFLAANSKRKVFTTQIGVLSTA